MKRRFFAAFVFLTLPTQFLFAQKSHTPPTPEQIIANRVARLTTLLLLNTSQAAEATTIFTTEQSALSGVAASMKTARTALQTAVQANDASGISTQANAIGNLTMQEVGAQATANAAFYALLNPAQQAQYKQLGGLRGNGGPGGGRGPFGGPGGFGARGRRN